jgi:hypothetical protein
MEPNGSKHSKSEIIFLGLNFLNKIIAIIKVIASAIGIAKNIPCVSNKNGRVKINNTGKIKLLDKAIIIKAKGL